MRIATALALTGSLFAATSALAENCTIAATVAGNFGGPGISASATSALIGSTITAANTAFLLQSTAFIGSPPNPAPNQQGGGVWIRGVVGNVDIKSSSSVDLTGKFPVVGAGTATVGCIQQTDVNFGGFQIGRDLATLNYNSWNFHTGVTAGDLAAKAVITGGYPIYLDAATGTNQGGGPFDGDTHVPFIGFYAAATNGGFAIDALLRTEFYQSVIDAPIANIFNNQAIDARGWSFATSVSYQWPVPDTNWFVEPSAGLIISRIWVDPFVFQSSGFGNSDSFASILQLNDIDSTIGRIGLRVGDTIQAGNVYWQPFGAVSIWHEFGKDITADYTTAQGFQQSAPLPAGLATVTGSAATTNFGTYGQYSLGLSAAIAGTGWLEFIRADYRSGPELSGWSGSGGIRYQFTPGPAAPVVAKAKAPPAPQPVNWTGFYVGGFGGANQGTADWGYGAPTFGINGEVAPHIAGYLFGGEVGYDYEFSHPWLIGIQADGSRSLTQGGMACGQSISTATPAPTAMYQMTCNARFDWLASVAARAGYIWDRAMFYGQIGVAWTDQKFQATCNWATFNLPIGPYHCTDPLATPGVLSNGFSATTNRAGWLLGWGTEYAVTNNWFAKGEAAYISFGDRNITTTDPTNGDSILLRVGMHVWEEKIGVDYHF